MANNTGSPTTEERFGSINSRIMDLQVRVTELERRLTCPKNETANDAKSTGADASLKVHGGMSSPKSSDCCELRNSSDCSVSGGTTPSVPASRSTGGIAGTGSSDPLAEAIRAYREARWDHGPIDISNTDNARLFHAAKRLADEAAKAVEERVEWRAEVEEYSQAADHWKARAEKAEAERDAILKEKEDDGWHRGWQLAVQERDAAHKEIVRLTGEEAHYRGEAEELRKSITRLQEYCQRHELSGLGTYVDDCVTAECDRLRAALKVELKSVDEMRDNILYVYESGGVKKASTRVLDRDVYAWCHAVDERRKQEAT